MYNLPEPISCHENFKDCTFPLDRGTPSYLNPLPDNKIFDWSKMKQIADDIFKFDENSRKFSKRVENTVGKGEIARYKQILLFPQCFQNACFLEASKGVIVWECVSCHILNPFVHKSNITYT